MRLRLEFAAQLQPARLRRVMYAVPPKLRSVGDLVHAILTDPTFSLEEV